MNSKSIVLGIKQIYGNKFVMFEESENLQLDLSENGVPCITNFLKGSDYAVLDINCLQSLNNLFKYNDSDKILSKNYSTNSSKISMNKICDAIVICNFKENATLNLIEVKKTIGHRTFHNEIIPQLEISYLKTMILLSVLQSVSLSDLQINFIAIGNIAEKDREMIDTAITDDEYAYNRFLRTGKINKKLPTVVKDDIFNENYNRKNIGLFHKPLNTIIDLDELI